MRADRVGAWVDSAGRKQLNSEVRVADTCEEQCAVVRTARGQQARAAHAADASSRRMQGGQQAVSDSGAPAVDLDAAARSGDVCG